LNALHSERGFITGYFPIQSFDGDGAHPSTNRGKMKIAAILKIARENQLGRNSTGRLVRYSASERTSAFRRRSHAESFLQFSSSVCEQTGTRLAG